MHASSPRPRSLRRLRHRLSRLGRAWTALAVIAVAVVAPVVAAGTAQALGAGEVCVFFAPDGADGLGHVGWGFRVDQQDNWIYGAAENPSGQLVSANNGFWYHQGPMAQMISEFRTLSYWAGAEPGYGAPAQPYYQNFKCLSFSQSSNVGAAINEVDSVVGSGYKIVGWNCEDVTYAILSAYNTPSSQLPSPHAVADWTPYDWFENLTSDGWASEPMWGSLGIPLHGETWKNYNSGQLLDLTGASTAEGAYVEQWPANGSSSTYGRSNQYWTKFPDSNGAAFRIVNTNSDLCMGVAGGSTEAGARILQWQCNGNLDQEWSYDFTGIYQDGWPVFNIVDENSGDCLGVQGGSTAQGAEVVQWPCNGNPDQKWF